jgi:DNA-binding NarL/FixJ family response regulator
MIQQVADGSAPGSVFEWPLRVLIVDGEASTRGLLRGVLDGCSQFDVAGEGEDGAAAIELAEVLQPDVVLIGLAMPVSEGSIVVRGLLRVAPEVRVIVRSGMDERMAAALLAAGAAGFVSSGLAPSQLLERLGSVLGRPVTVAPSPPARQPPAAAPPASLHAQSRAIICDDDAVTRRLVAQLLATCDVPVIAETDGVANLLSIVGMAQPELVVLDLWLAGESGTSALPEIRKISARTAVVVYSANDAWKGRALPEGAAAFVTKPDFDELKATIQRLTAMTTC